MRWPPQPLMPARYDTDPHAPQAGGKKQPAAQQPARYDGVATLGVPAAISAAAGTLPPGVDASAYTCGALQRRRADLAARGIAF